MEIKAGKIGQYLADGLTAKEIGEKMGVSKRTIETYIGMIKHRMDAKNTHHLVSILHRFKMVK